MIQPNNISKPRKGQHLSLGERIQFQSLLHRGFSNRAIDRLLGRPHATISTRTLYTYIDLSLIELTNMDLLLKLRRNTKRYNTRRNKRILGTSIEDRPKEVNDRNDFGH